MGMIDTIQNPPNHASNSPNVAPNNANNILSPPNNANNSSPSNGCFPPNNQPNNANPPPYYQPNYGYYTPHRPMYVLPGQFAYGNVYNSGGNVNESGKQTNGHVIVGNHTRKTGGVDIKSIGGNIGNKGGQQVTGDVKIANIGA
ncbi:unnamed protein product [Amaranthus hypochondriacus]